MKKRVLSSIIGAVLACAPGMATAVESSGFTIRIPMKEKLSTWQGIAPTYHPWTDVGNHYDCESWSPEPNTINFGQSFTQSRDCNQNQTRNVDIRQKDSFSDNISIVRTEVENRTITETENQPSVGTFRDWKITSSTFTEWQDIASDYDFQSWSPAAASQTADFQQTRDYKRDQERFEQKREQDAVTGDIRNIGDPISHVETRTRSQQRDVAVAVTSWSDVGNHYDCEAWSPKPEEVDVYEDFTQTRDCSQNQTRRWSYDSQGSEIHARVQNQTITETESQESVGTRRQWIAHDSTFTEWEDYGSTHSHTAWSPTPVAQTSNFTQTRSYKMPQEQFEQEREIDTVSGEIKDVNSPIRHTKDDPRTDSRLVVVDWTAWVDTNRTGHTAWLPAAYNETADFQQTREYGQHQIRDRFYKTGSTELHRQGENRVVSPVYENRTVSVTVNAWANTNRSGHTSWGPANYTETADFTQTRKYTQNQERTWNYAAGAEQLDTRLETRGVANQTESRNIDVSATAWANTDRDSHTSWSPAIVSQTASFQQSRTYRQNQERTWSYKTGSSTLDTRLETRGLSSQNESRTVDVTWSNWVVSKDDYNCGAWGPATNTKAYGESFTQTRSCSEDQTRNRIYKVGSTTVDTKGEAKTINVSQSRAATGIGSWVDYTASCGSWSNSGSPYSYSSYSPSAGTQTSNFTQTRSYKQNQVRTCQPRERDTISGAIRNTGSSYIQTQTLNKSQSRSVTASWGSWTHSSYHSYSGYSPATNTVCSGTSFTQTETYKQRQVRTINYSIGGTGPSQTQDVNKSRTRSATGTKDCWAPASTTCTSWSGWSYSYGSWSPSTSTVNLGQSFTQSRGKSGKRTRTCYEREYNSSTGQYRTTRTYTNTGTSYTTETRSATGTKDYVVSSDHRIYSTSYSSWSCGIWTPPSNFYNVGTRFTQTRTCNRTKTVTYNKYYKYASGKLVLRQSNIAYSSTNESKTESQYAWGTGSSNCPKYTICDIH